MKQLQYCLITLLSLLLVTSCVKEDFDEPPVQGETDPDIETNATIEDITNMWVEGEFVTVEEDLVLDAIVIADDRSGNYYRSIVIQDETGGIALLINARDLHNDYPIGRRIFLHCKDLIVNDYGGTIQLGGGTYVSGAGDLRLGGIEEALKDQFITKGVRNQTVTPSIKTISELGRSDISTLVQLEGIQFNSSDTASTYADAINMETVNLDLENCDGQNIIIRSSGFAEFAGQNVPDGNGTIIGVYSVFNNTKQLYIRNADDVNFDQSRCGTTGGGDCDDITGSLMNIQDVRNSFSGSTTTLPTGRYIEGTVISNLSGGNINEQNVVIEGDDGFGILVRYSSPHQFQQNDRIKVDVSGQELSEYRGLLQINNVPLSNSCALGSETITPEVTTISQILANFEDYESTLVQIDNVLLSKSGGDDWIYSVRANDGTAQIDIYTSPGAAWAGQSFPTDTLRVTAYVSQGGTQESMQLSIRSLADVVVIGGGGSTGEGIDEDFQSGIDEMDIDLNEWTNTAVEGNRVWRYSEFDGNIYAQATAYRSNDATNETWLITPAINTTEYNLLTFESAQAFYNHDGLSVWVSNDFNSNIASATWVELEEARIAGQSDEEHAFVPSGEVDLSPFGNNVHVAFKYVGSAPNATTSYRIDNVKVVAP